jgi:hypothetical protein
MARRTVIPVKRGAEANAPFYLPGDGHHLVESVFRGPKKIDLFLTETFKRAAST